MNLKKLLYFKTIVEQGQISRAARVLHISQPPLSQRLKELEDDLGVTLINRAGTNWAVTSEGKVLYQRALQILDMVEDIPAAIQQARHGVEGTATVGCTTLALSVLLRFLPFFNTLHPGVTLRLVVEDSSLLVHKLQEHAYDFCVMLMPQNQAWMELTPLPSTPSRLIVPEALATAAVIQSARRTTPLPPKELEAMPLVIFRRIEGGGLYEQFLDAFSSYGIRPRIILDCPACSVIINLVEYGLEAAAIVPCSEIPRRIYTSHLVCPLPDSFPMVRPCIAQVDKRYLSRAARVACDTLKSFVGNETCEPGDG